MLDILLWGLKASPVLYSSFEEALGYVNCNFLSKKVNFFQLYFFQFLVNKTLDPEQDPDVLEMLDPYPYPDSINLNPQHCFLRDWNPGVKSPCGYLSPGKGTECLMKLLLILQGNALQTNTDKFRNINVYKCTMKLVFFVKFPFQQKFSKK